LGVHDLCDVLSWKLAAALSKDVLCIIKLKHARERRYKLARFQGEKGSDGAQKCEVNAATHDMFRDAFNEKSGGFVQ
jgi:hypothetical protein